MKTDMATVLRKIATGLVCNGWLHQAQVVREAADEIIRLRDALRVVDQDARDHIRSDEIAPALLRPHALRAVRAALNAK